MIEDVTQVKNCNAALIKFLKIMQLNTTKMILAMQVRVLHHLKHLITTKTNSKREMIWNELNWSANKIFNEKFMRIDLNYLNRNLKGLSK